MSPCFIVCRNREDKVLGFVLSKVTSVDEGEKRKGQCDVPFLFLFLFRSLVVNVYEDNLNHRVYDRVSTAPVTATSKRQAGFVNNIPFPPRLGIA